MAAFLRTFVFLLAGIAASFGETAANHAVRLAARVSSSPASIKLLWLRDADSLGYAVSRKTAAATAWGSPVALPSTATQYVDTHVAAGVVYEYRVIKVARTYKGYGFISAAIAGVLVQDRGKIVLVVESGQAGPLSSELARLQQDLTGDGWTVLRHDVSRTASVASVKDLIMADYHADPTKVRALFLFGHVPVPYSGNYAPDEHPEHVGAWPADVYYGIDSDAWTDTNANNSNGSDVRTRNVPGDGKFDQSYLPKSVALQIGRVDLANLYAFSKSETELLRQYLNRDHAWRFGQLVADPVGLVGDQFGAYGGEAFAADAWSNFSALLGPGRVFANQFYPTVIDHSQTFAYACGGGSYTNVGSEAYESQFAGQQSRAVFVGLFGSFFGDWDSADNLLRSPLANSGFGLASMWAGRPFWYLQMLGQGQTLGYCARLAQNNSTLYPAGKYARGVHIALMGDPTLRLHVVPPPSNLRASNVNGAVKLTWTAPVPAPFGYHIYRAATAEGPYTRANKTVVRALSFTDIAPLAGATYQVRAIKLQGSNSGTYWNQSQGMFVAAP